MASQTKTLTVSYTEPTSAARGDFVLIEQQTWDPNVNLLTKLGAIGYVLSLIDGGSYSTENCSNLSDGCQVYAYPSHPDLNYFIDTSHGSLTPATIEKLVYSEILNCDLKTELTPHYPVAEIVGTPEWIGDPLGVDGGATDRPMLTITDANTISVSEEVYGSVLLTYTLWRHTRTLFIEPLAGALENALQCWIYALWEGGRQSMEYQFPVGSDTINSDGQIGTCQGSKTNYNGTVTVNPNPMLKCITPEDEYVSVDYCDQKI